MADGFSCSDSPLESKRMPWDQLILPLESPVAVEAGDEVEATIRTSSVGKDAVLLWHVSIRDGEGSYRAQFRQSSFEGFLLAKGDLEKAALGPDSTVR